MHNQRLPIRHRRNRNISVKLEGFAHTCAKGDVGDLAVGLDLGEDGGEGGVCCGAVGRGFGWWEEALGRVLVLACGGGEGGGRRTILKPIYIPATNPALALVST